MLKRLTVVVGLCVAAAGCTHVTQGVRVATHTALTVANAAPDPENGPLNGGQWAQLEAAIRKWVEDGVVRNARMITGGFFYDPAEDSPSTADGIITFQQIGPGNVAVPTHIFKIVVGEGIDGQPRAIAFVAANKKPRTGWKFTDAIVSIQFVEERAGLNRGVSVGRSGRFGSRLGGGPVVGARGDPRTSIGGGATSGFRDRHSGNPRV